MSPPPVDARRRILFAGGPDMTRRLRMTAKVIAECRRRGQKLSAVSCGSVPDEFLRMAPPDEIHPDVIGQELVNLFASSTLLLETANEPGDLTAAANLADALGIPVLSFAGAGRGGDVNVPEWSADAFADALQNPAIRRGSPDAGAVDAVIAGMAVLLE